MDEYLAQSQARSWLSNRGGVSLPDQSCAQKRRIFNNTPGASPNDSDTEHFLQEHYA